MDKGRLILLGVAVAAGAGAFFIAARDGGDAADAVPAPVQERASVRVLVADVTFLRGQIVDPAFTTWVKWPKDQVPEHLVTEDDQAFYEELPSLRAKTTIYEGEPIIKAKTAAQGDRGLLAALLTPGMRAVSAAIAGQATSSGFVMPGDRVDILGTFGGATEPVLENVKVLAIDNIVGNDGETGDQGFILGRTVTFELAPAEVELFLDARENGTLTLALRSLAEGEAEAAGMPTGEVIVLRYGQG